MDNALIVPLATRRFDASEVTLPMSRNDHICAAMMGLIKVSRTNPITKKVNDEE